MNASRFIRDKSLLLEVPLAMSTVAMDTNKDGRVAPTCRAKSDKGARHSCLFFFECKCYPRSSGRKRTEDWQPDARPQFGFQVFQKQHSVGGNLTSTI